MPELIDVHHHIVPKEYVDSLAKKGITKALGVQFPAWNVKKALDKPPCQSRLKGSGSIAALLPKTEERSSKKMPWISFRG